MSQTLLPVVQFSVLSVSSGKMWKMGLSWNLNIKKIQNAFHEKKLFLMNHLTAEAEDRRPPFHDLWPSDTNRWTHPVATTTWSLSDPLCLTTTWPEESTCPRSSTAWAPTAPNAGSWSRWAESQQVSRVDVPLCSPPPAVIEAAPRFFSTPGGTFANSWSCFCLGTRESLTGKHLFVATAFFRRRRELVFAKTLVRQLEVNHSPLRPFVLR